MADNKSLSPDTRFWILIITQFVIGLLLGILIVMGGGSIRSNQNLQAIRNAAASLQAAGLIGEAISLYENYLNGVVTDPKTRSAMAYSLASLYESQNLPEKALSWYYQVEASGSLSEHKAESAKRIVALLESLGRTHVAKAVLDQATQLQSQVKKEGPVVAKIGPKEVTLDELNSALDMLPPPVRDSFSKPKDKENFLKKFVADHVLFEKAKRLQYDSDSKFTLQIEEIKKQLLVQRVLQEEVFKKIQVDESDLKNFYQTNKSKYTRDKRTPKFEEIRPAVEQDYRLRSLSPRSQGKI